MARELRIVRRRRASATEVASPTDFTARYEGDVDFPSTFALHRREISPYCVDLANERMLFTWTPRALDLASAHPFYYQAQREHAVRLLDTSFTEAHALAAATPDETRFAFLYSAGRSGSTVVGKMADALPTVQTVSEHDVYSQVAMARLPGDHARERVLEKVTATATRLLGAHLVARRPERPVILVKHRGMVLYAADLVQRVAPSSRALFLERDVLGVVDSYCGAFLRGPGISFLRRLGLDRLAVRVMRALWPVRNPEVQRFMPIVLEPGTPDRDRHGIVELLALGWVAMMRHARFLETRAGVPFHGVLRYETLSAEPMRFVQTLASALAVPLDEDALRAVLGRTRGDAQAGSEIASDRRSRLDAADVRRIHHLLAQLGDVGPFLSGVP